MANVEQCDKCGINVTSIDRNLRDYRCHSHDKFDEVRSWPFEMEV